MARIMGVMYTTEGGVHTMNYSVRQVRRTPMSVVHAVYRCAYYGKRRQKRLLAHYIADYKFKTGNGSKVAVFG